MAETSIHAALDDYQRFTQTVAVYPPSFADHYLGLGLGDEAGELLEKVVDAESMTPPVVRSILSECGDVLWYLAQSLLKRGITLSHIYAVARTLESGHEASLRGAACEVVIAAAGMQGRLKKHLRDGVFDDARYQQYAARLLRAIDNIARVMGSSLVILMAENRGKLTGREARGTLQGEGDIR